MISCCPHPILNPQITILQIMPRPPPPPCPQIPCALPKSTTKLTSNEPAIKNVRNSRRSFVGYIFAFKGRECRDLLSRSYISGKDVTLQALYFHYLNEQWIDLMTWKAKLQRVQGLMQKTMESFFSSSTLDPWFTKVTVMKEQSPQNCLY